jgi:hypothetical protein
MHMFDVTRRPLGGYGIVGGQLPLATGAALDVDYKGGDEVVMCTLRDRGGPGSTSRSSTRIGAEVAAPPRYDHRLTAIPPPVRRAGGSPAYRPAGARGSGAGYGGRARGGWRSCERWAG